MDNLVASPSDNKHGGKHPRIGSFSFTSVCSFPKKLPVNLSDGNPTGEAPPANMYGSSKMGRLNLGHV